MTDIYLFAVYLRAPRCVVSHAGAASFAADCLLQAHTTPLPRLFLVELTQYLGLRGGCGSKPMVPFGVGAPPILVYSTGDWDVHWGYGTLTHGQVIGCFSNHASRVRPFPRGSL